MQTLFRHLCQQLKREASRTVVWPRPVVEELECRLPLAVDLTGLVPGGLLGNTPIVGEVFPGQANKPPAGTEPTTPTVPPGGQAQTLPPSLPTTPGFPSGGGTT